MPPNAAAFSSPPWMAEDCHVMLSPFALLEVGGDDARAFLHAQLTSDVKALDATNAQFSAWCNAQGRMLVNVILHAHRDAAGDETLRLFMRADRLPEILRRLQKYVLRAKVSLAARVDLGVLGVCGASFLSTAFGFAPPPEDAALGVSACDETTIIRLPDDRCLITAPRVLLDEYARRLAERCPAADVQYWQWRDICAALPWIENATAEAFVPQMLDFEKTGVSFRKGCYPGQEIIARAHYQGEVKRHLYRLAAPSPLRIDEDLYANADPRQPIGKVIAAAPVPHDPGRHAALVVLLDAHAHDLAPLQPQRLAYAGQKTEDGGQRK